MPAHPTARTTVHRVRRRAQPLPANGSRPSPAPAAAAVPAPTIRTVIVCVPDELPGEMFDRRLLDRHFGVRCAPAVRFWAKNTNLIRRRQLIDPGKGKPTPCAGGPLRMLDMAALRQSYRLAAVLRSQTFNAVIGGTRDARPWVHYLQRHLSESDYPLAQAQTDYRNQPRVLAVRAHNAVTYGRSQLDEHELEMFQAGPAAYGNYQQLLAMAADALLTPDGHRLCPTSDRFADRLTYLQQANRYLDTTDDRTRIVAVLLTE